MPGGPSVTDRTSDIYGLDRALRAGGGNWIPFSYGYRSWNMHGQEKNAGNARQVLTLNGTGLGGNFTLSWNGQGPTANIAYNATAATVQSALQALANIGATCNVTGNAGGPWTVAFYGANLNTHTLITANTAGVTGTGVSMTITGSQLAWQDATFICYHPIQEPVSALRARFINAFTRDDSPGAQEYDGNWNSGTPLSTLYIRCAIIPPSGSGIPPMRFKWNGQDASDGIFLYPGQDITSLDLAMPLSLSNLANFPTLTFPTGLTQAFTIRTYVKMYANGSQVLTVAGSPTGGTFKLYWNGNATGTIAYNASAGTVQTAIEALTGIGAANTTVTGSAGGPWTITVTGGANAGTTIPFVPDSFGLTGGTTPYVWNTALTYPCGRATYGGATYPEGNNQDGGGIGGDDTLTALGSPTSTAFKSVQARYVAGPVQIYGLVARSTPVANIFIDSTGSGRYDTPDERGGHWGNALRAVNIPFMNVSTPGERFDGQSDLTRLFPGVVRKHRNNLMQCGNWMIIGAGINDANSGFTPYQYLMKAVEIGKDALAQRMNLIFTTPLPRVQWSPYVSGNPDLTPIGASGLPTTQTFTGTISCSGTTLTDSGAGFNSGQVGYPIVVTGQGLFFITAYTNASTVTIDTAATFSSASGNLYTVGKKFCQTYFYRYMGAGGLFRRLGGTGGSAFTSKEGCPCYQGSGFSQFVYVADQAALVTDPATESWNLAVWNYATMIANIQDGVHLTQAGYADPLLAGKLPVSLIR